MSSATAPTTTPPVISIPMSPNEDALKIFESTLRASVLASTSIHPCCFSGSASDDVIIIVGGHKSRRWGLVPRWHKLKVVHCKPLFETMSWVREEIKQRTKILIEVVIVQGTPATFQNVGIPYPRPPSIGYSFGVAEEQLGKHDKSYSGTLGGFLVLPAMDNLQVALTCNHVGNPRDLVPKDEAPEKLTTHVMRCPSNEDNAETIRKAAASLVLLSDQVLFNKDKKVAFKKLMDAICWEDIPSKIEKVVCPRGSGRQIGDAWDAFQQGNIGQDFVTAMASLPTATELHDGKAAIEKCKLGGQIQELRARFDKLWNEEMANASSAAYRQSRDADRQLGTTKFASGLRVWPNSAAPARCIVDWALVATPGVHGVNDIPEALKSLANTAYPGCPLAQGKPITSFSALKAGETVFKLGRTSGTTAGIVDASKVRISQDWLKRMDVLPADGKLEGRASAFADEWNVSGVGYDKGRLVKKRLQFALPGDSGAWVVNASAELVGMVWCGMPSEKQSYMQDVTMVWESVRMVTGLQVAFAK